MKKYFLLALLVASTNGMASGSVAGKVTELRAAVNTPAVLFRVNAEIKDTPKCNEWEMLAVDLSKIGGDAMLQLVKLAKEHDYTVEVTGLGTCGGHWKSEDVKEITIR
jgi:hypothetical protein